MAKVKYVRARKVDDKWVVTCPTCQEEIELDHEPAESGYSDPITCPCGQEIIPLKGRR